MPALPTTACRVRHGRNWPRTEFAVRLLADSLRLDHRLLHGGRVCRRSPSAVAHRAERYRLRVSVPGLALLHLGVHCVLCAYRILRCNAYARTTAPRPIAISGGGPARQ